jgi:3-deoxy-D-manno-octulosonic-acid transferase
VVETEDELFKTIEFFIRNPDAAKEMGLKAQKVVNNKRGATNRNIEIIRNIITKTLERERGSNEKRKPFIYF